MPALSFLCEDVTIATYTPPQWEAIDAEDSLDLEARREMIGGGRPCEPTEVLPGPAKVAVFERRYALRQDLFSPRDPRVGERDAILLVPRTRSRRSRPDRGLPAALVPVRETAAELEATGPAVHPRAGRRPARKKYPSDARTDEARAREREVKRRARAAEEGGKAPKRRSRALHARPGWQGSRHSERQLRQPHFQGLGGEPSPGQEDAIQALEGG